MTHEKKVMLIAGVFGFGVWGVAGFAYSGWEGAIYLLAGVGLVACMCHTIGSLWAYFVSPQSIIIAGRDTGYYGDSQLSVDVAAALAAFRIDTKRNPFGPPTEDEARARIIKDWLILRGYLDEEHAELGMDS